MRETQITSEMIIGMIEYYQNCIAEIESLDVQGDELKAVARAYEGFNELKKLK